MHWNVGLKPLRPVLLSVPLMWPRYENWRTWLSYIDQIKGFFIWVKISWPVKVYWLLGIMINIIKSYYIKYVLYYVIIYTSMYKNMYMCLKLSTMHFYDIYWILVKHLIITSTFFTYVHMTKKHRQLRWPLSRTAWPWACPWPFPFF